MKVFITGITGFVERHLAEHLLTNHPDVEVLSKFVLFQRTLLFRPTTSFERRTVHLVLQCKDSAFEISFAIRQVSLSVKSANCKDPVLCLRYLTINR